MPTAFALDRVLHAGAPERFGRYELLGRLGAGGMAEVFVARCGEIEGLRALVAVKRILPHLAEDEAFVRLFQREARIALRLRHRAIAGVIEVGQVGSAWFFSMELVPGESLAHLLRAERAVGLRGAPPLVAWVGAEVAAALHHAHRSTDERGAPLGIVHRDVSPQNVLLAYDGGVKLIDFGVARCAAFSVGTRAGTIRGKLAYTSPEQIRGGPVDARSDIFSLGIVLHEWLAGRPLFERPDDAATLQAVLEAPVPPIPGIPRELDRAVRCALERDPARRPADADAFARLLLAGGAPPGGAGASLVAGALDSRFADRKGRWEAILRGGESGAPPPSQAAGAQPATVPGTRPGAEPGGRPARGAAGPRGGRRSALRLLAVGGVTMGAAIVVVGRQGAARRGAPPPRATAPTPPPGPAPPAARVREEAPRPEPERPATRAPAEAPPQLEAPAPPPRAIAPTAPPPPPSTPRYPPRPAAVRAGRERVRRERAPQIAPAPAAPRPVERAAAAAPGGGSLADQLEPSPYAKPHARP